MRERPKIGPAVVSLSFLGGGVACVLGALLLGFYLTHTSSSTSISHTRTHREIIAQYASSGDRQFNVNIPAWEPPGSITGIMWATFGVGCFLILSSMKVGRPPRRAEGAEKRPWPEV